MGTIHLAHESLPKPLRVDGGEARVVHLPLVTRTQVRGLVIGRRKKAVSHDTNAGTAEITGTGA